jgi:hypothetical protein
MVLNNAGYLRLREAVYGSIAPYGVMHLLSIPKMKPGDEPDDQ